MPSWGNNNNAANAPRWAVTTSGLQRRANSNNVSLLFGNTTPNVWVQNETVGLFGVDANTADASKGWVHTGWVVQTVGQGGRAGRVQSEVLVATSSMFGVNSSPQFPNTIITIVTAPVSNSVVHGTGSNTLTISVAATGSNPLDPLVYNWFYANSNGVYFATSSNTAFTGNTSNTLVASTLTTAVNGTTVYCSITSPSGNAATVNTVPVSITVT